MEELLLSILMMMSRLEGVHDAPAVVPPSWNSSNKWEQTSEGLVFSAVSTLIPEQCRANPDSKVKFPVVLYGAQLIELDHKRIMFGDPTMKSPNYVASAPVLDCKNLANINKVHWTVTAYSKYFARINAYPSVVAHDLTRLFGETLYIGSAVGLIVLSIFAMSILYGKESTRLMFALWSSIMGMAVYQISLIAPAFEIALPMVTVHRIGDLGMIFGAGFVIMCFWIERLIPTALLTVNTVATALSLPFILLGDTGDSIQFGTTIPFPTIALGFAVATYRLWNEYWTSRNLQSTLIFCFSVVFMFVVVNDMTVFTGSHNGYTFMSFGVLFAFLILLLAVNQRISGAYNERDYLRANLEKEVERKTAELRDKTRELETAMQDLRHTQAELIQSAKLASLGTLSAGIAHEINNSINFVNGAITPLERVIAKLETTSPRDHEIGRKLLSAIKDGISITVEIVRSLRQFTGLNQAKLKDVNLADVVRSVTTILTPKLKGRHQVVVEIPETLAIYGDVVGINQILMNLFTNAADAMPEGGTIRVRATDTRDATILELIDNGTGIPEEIRSRIFDPFFTTKEVGSGTGLGLHIIRKEMEKHHGSVTVDSTVGQGTTFRLEFPKKQAMPVEVAA